MIYPTYAIWIQTCDWLRLLRFPTTTQFQRFQGFHGFCPPPPLQYAPWRLAPGRSVPTGQRTPVDGKNPAPVDRGFIHIFLLIFLRFQPSLLVVQDFFHPQISTVSSTTVPCSHHTSVTHQRFPGCGKDSLEAPLRMLQLPGPHLHLAKALWPLQWGLAPGPAGPRYHAL